MIFFLFELLVVTDLFCGLYSIQVFTTHHWMVRIYKLKPPKNRLRGKTKKSKAVCRNRSSIVLRIFISMYIYRFQSMDIGLRTIIICLAESYFNNELKEKWIKKEPLALKKNFIGFYFRSIICTAFLCMSLVRGIVRAK